MSEKPFVLPIKTPLGCYFYEVNRNEVVAVNENLFNYIQNKLSDTDKEIVPNMEKAQSEYDELRACGYLSSQHVEFIQHTLTGEVENLLARRMEKITLQVTQNCNLRCAYCIYSENSNLGQRSHSTNTMSLKTAEKAIDFYRAHSIDSETASIGFYGGEPLLAFPLIKDTVAYAEEIFDGKEINYAITTNATLLTDEIIEYLLEKNFNILISIDGPKEIQNKNRKFKNGIGSYDIVIKNINRLYEKNPKRMKSTSISMVVDPSQDYSEIIKLFNEPALKDVHLTYTFVEEDATYLPPTEDYTEKYNYDMFLALTQYFRGNGKNYPSKLAEQDVISFSDGNRRFKLNLLGSLGAPGGPCIPGKMRMLVNCFGELYPCERVNENSCMKIGTLDSGINFDQVRTLLNIGGLTAQKCKNCWAFSLCSVCAKRADDKGTLDVEKKIQACSDAKRAAYGKILNKILVYENEMHMRKILSEGVL